MTASHKFNLKDKIFKANAYFILQWNATNFCMQGHDNFLSSFLSFSLRNHAKVSRKKIRQKPCHTSKDGTKNWFGKRSGMQ